MPLPTQFSFSHIHKKKNRSVNYKFSKKTYTTLQAHIIFTIAKSPYHRQIPHIHFVHILCSVPHGHGRHTKPKNNTLRQKLSRNSTQTTCFCKTSKMFQTAFPASLNRASTMCTERWHIYSSSLSRCRRIHMQKCSFIGAHISPMYYSVRMVYLWIRVLSLSLSLFRLPTVKIFIRPSERWTRRFGTRTRRLLVEQRRMQQDWTVWHEGRENGPASERRKRAKACTASC